MGSIETAGRYEDGLPRYRFRVRLADGTRSERNDVPREESHTLEQARAYVTSIQAGEDALHTFFDEKRAKEQKVAAATQQPHDLETWEAWFARYLPTKECSAGHRHITQSVEKKWISSVIGPKPIRSLTKDDVEDVRDRIDRAIDALEIRHSTARNAWGTFTCALKAAYAGRDRSLRVLSSPIHFGVLPPKKGATRQRPWLYPREWQAFASCNDIPVEFRQLCALALYTGLRPGELRALLWSDVDFDARTISISKAIDGNHGAVKAPKTVHGQRVIPIQEALLPLLQSRRGAPTDNVIGSLGRSEDHAATSFRKYLMKAKIARARLTADNATEEPIDFRGLRDTHATWLALAGTSTTIIQRRMGHAAPTTTDRYVKVAESFSSDNVGTPFPPLPETLMSGVQPNVWPTKVKNPGLHRGISVARVGFEPTTFGL